MAQPGHLQNRHADLHSDSGRRGMCRVRMLAVHVSTHVRSQAQPAWRAGRPLPASRRSRELRPRARGRRPRSRPVSTTTSNPSRRRRGRWRGRSSRWRARRRRAGGRPALRGRRGTAGPSVLRLEGRVGVLVGIHPLGHDDRPGRRSEAGMELRRPASPARSEAARLRRRPGSAGSPPDASPGSGTRAPRRRAKRSRYRLTTGTMASPPRTPRAPPGQKSFWRSTTTSASRVGSIVIRASSPRGRRPSAPPASARSISSSTPASASRARAARSAARAAAPPIRPSAHAAWPRTVGSERAQRLGQRRHVGGRSRGCPGRPRRSAPAPPAAPA